MPKKNKKNKPSDKKINKQLEKARKHLKMRKIEKKVLQDYLEEADFSEKVNKKFENHDKWNTLFNEVNAMSHLQNAQKEIRSAKDMMKQLKDLRDGKSDSSKKQKGKRK